MTAFTLVPLQATWCTAGQLSGKYWERGPKGGRGVSWSLQTLWPTAGLRQTKQGKRGHSDRWQAALAVALSVCVSGWRPFMSSTCARLSVCLLGRYLISLTCKLFQPSGLINTLLPCIFEDKMWLFWNIKSRLRALKCFWTCDCSQNDHNQDLQIKIILLVAGACWHHSTTAGKTNMAVSFYSFSCCETRLFYDTTLTETKNRKL